MTRDQIMEKLYERNINTRPGTHAVHLLDYYKNRFMINHSDYPAALQCHKTTLALPLHNRLDAKDYSYISEILHTIN